jgi:glycosyltransferase involved in cell wall biosynthesis
MVSFQARLAQGLSERGLAVCYSLGDKPYQAVLVIGGIRDLAGLWRARRQGVRIVQRLDGMNWLHHRLPTGIKHHLRAEYGNLILSQIRAHLANKVVYQSNFSEQWWEQAYGLTPVPCDVVYNGVDLNRFHPEGLSHRPENCFRILMVEGTLGGGYETGLETAIQLVRRLNQESSGLKNEVDLMVAGKVSPSLKDHWLANAGIPLVFTDLVPPEGIPELDRSAHLLYSADLNAACPNAVIEALGCGLPVVAYNTGALPEMVSEDAGRIAPYGGDPWKLDPPDIESLAQASIEILREPERFRRGARLRAEQTFNLGKMVDGYLNSLLGE